MSLGHPYNEQPTSRVRPQDQFTDHHLTISNFWTVPFLDLKEDITFHENKMIIFMKCLNKYI